MPTVLTDGPYQFVFFSSDRAEPRHIHVKRDRQVVKFWLEPIALARNQGFADHELRVIERLVHQHLPALLRGWDEFFST